MEVLQYLGRLVSRQLPAEMRCGNLGENTWLRLVQGRFKLANKMEESRS